jgi:hypothetical protein
MNCGKQMKRNTSIEFHLPLFLLGSSNLFLPAILKYGPLLTIDSPLFRTLGSTHETTY